MKELFDFDRNLYQELLQSVAGMTLLFSDGPHAYIDYRFVEKLFVRSTKGRDISRSDKVFDAIVGKKNDIGVGVKTFVMGGAGRTSLEKIQEFTKFSGSGAFDNLQKSEIAIKASEYRNNTVLADSKEFGIKIEKSIYHCLVRSGNFGIIHEEPYPLINIKNIEPIDLRGRTLTEFPDGSKGIRFTDGVNTYSYSKSKSVLMKVFDLQLHTNLEPIPLKIDSDIWDKIGTGFFESSKIDQIQSLSNLGRVDDEPEVLIPGIDYVVLPLYSNKSGHKVVQEKSGINQWNAGGRERKYGESYIPITSKIHKLAPGFFPVRDKPFELLLPNSNKPVSAKVCQDNGKALMSNPNDRLCRWLYKVIDLNFSDYDFDRTPNRAPFTYEDLVKVGRDSVIVIKDRSTSNPRYEIRFAELDSYEEFLNLFDEEDAI
jgi:hypothetical protein